MEITNYSTTMIHDFIRFIKTLLKGAGQVMFQNSSATGVLFLLGITIGAAIEGRPNVAIGAILGLLTSTTTGYILKLSPEDGENGLWGFNGILVGCAFPSFMGNTPLMWMALILCAAMTTWVRIGMNNIMSSWKINSLTFPFVSCTWIFLLAAHSFDGLWGEYMSLPSLYINFSHDINISPTHLLVDWLRGISQVFLINSWFSGLLFLIGLYLCSRWAAFWAAISSAIALLIAIVFQASGVNTANGLYGFSAVLTGIALGCTFHKPSFLSAIWAILGVIVTIFIQGAMYALLTPFGIATLTAPFCITTWLFLLPRLNIDNPLPHEKSKLHQRPDHSHWHKRNIQKKLEE